VRSWTKLALVGLLAVVVAQLLVQRSAPPFAPGATPPLVLEDLAGRRVDLAALRGPVVLVNFWATWCGPCRQELPELAGAWESLHGRCVQLLGVAEESPLDEVRAVGARVPYPILVDRRAEAAAAWKVQGYPHTFLVDAEGTVRRSFAGAVTQAALMEAVAPHLPASCPGSQGGG
jgi:cytochrome c biogenesis protein CcmG/thiol:disulfide interchange protein DsbE